MNKIKELYARLLQMPFPLLGKQIGDFALYDTLLAGYADQVVQGSETVLLELPEPDEQSVCFANQLRTQAAMSTDERAFLEYFDLLDELGRALCEADPKR